MNYNVINKYLNDVLLRLPFIMSPSVPAIIRHADANGIGSADSLEGGSSRANDNAMSPDMQGEMRHRRNIDFCAHLFDQSTACR